MAPDSSDLEVISLLREQVAWLRAIALPTIRGTLETMFGSDAERIAYEASDGTRTGQDVRALAGVSAATVSGWWKKWRSLGVAVEVEPRRTAHLISLTDLGIPMPNRDAAGSAPDKEVDNGA